MGRSLALFVIKESESTRFEPVRVLRLVDRERGVDMPDVAPASSLPVRTRIRKGTAMTTLGAFSARSISATLLIAAATTWLAVSAPTSAQDPTLGMRNGNNPTKMLGIDPLPPAPPKGAWGEVIMANSKWLVIQNHEGQQFPIAVDSIEKFLIRWPTDLNAITENSVIEAIGVQVNATSMRTDHVDVFEGSNQNLVSPTFLTLNPNKIAQTSVDPIFNRFQNSAVMGIYNQQYGWVYPGAEDANNVQIGGDVTKIHVVQSATGNDPLSVTIGGNNSITILADESGPMTNTEVTRGNAGLADKGDFVYLVPTDMTPRTVVLSQVVLYKKMPKSQYKPPAVKP